MSSAFAVQGSFNSLAQKVSSSKDPRQAAPARQSQRRMLQGQCNIRYCLPATAAAAANIMTCPNSLGCIVYLHSLCLARRAAAGCALHHLFSELGGLRPASAGASSVTPTHASCLSPVHSLCRMPHVDASPATQQQPCREARTLTHSCTWIGTLTMPACLLVSYVSNTLRGNPACLLTVEAEAFFLTI